MVYRRPRAVLDPLGRSSGADILVRNESQLRLAIGAITSNPEPGRIVVTETIKLTSGISLGFGFSGGKIVGSGSAAVLCGDIDPVFTFENGGQGGDVWLANIGISGLAFSGSDLESLFTGRLFHFNATSVQRAIGFSLDRLSVYGSRMISMESGTKPISLSMIACDLPYQPASGDSLSLDATRSRIIGNYFNAGSIVVGSGGGRNVIANNVLGNSTVDTSASGGLNVIRGNANAGAITSHASDSVGGNT